MGALPECSCTEVSFQRALVFSQKIAAVTSFPAFADCLAVEALSHPGIGLQGAAFQFVCVGGLEFLLVDREHAGDIGRGQAIAGERLDLGGQRPLVPRSSMAVLIGRASQLTAPLMPSGAGRAGSAEAVRARSRDDDPPDLADLFDRPAVDPGVFVDGGLLPAGPAFSQKIAAVTDSRPSPVAFRNRFSATLALALVWP